MAGRASRPVSGPRTRGRRRLSPGEAFLAKTGGCVRQNRVVLTPQWLASSLAEGKSARPGADEPAIRGRRRQQSPILRGERVISRKAIAQGSRIASAEPVCSCASSSILHTRPRVQRASGIPCSLPLEGQRNASLGQSCRENADAYSAVWDVNSIATSRHCERSEAIHARQAKKEWIASLRSQ